MQVNIIKEFYETLKYVEDLISDRTYEQGIHWISAIKNKYNELVLFDSFGRDIHNLSKYFKHKHFICAIKRRLQSFKSYSCGAHCITFIIMYLKYQNHFLKYINS